MKKIAIAALASTIAFAPLAASANEAVTAVTTTKSTSAGMLAGLGLSSTAAIVTIGTIIAGVAIASSDDNS